MQNDMKKRWVFIIPAIFYALNALWSLIGYFLLSILQNAGETAVAASFSGVDKYINLILFCMCPGVLMGILAAMTRGKLRTGLLFLLSSAAVTLVVFPLSLFSSMSETLVRINITASFIKDILNGILNFFAFLMIASYAAESKEIKICSLTAAFTVLLNCAARSLSSFILLKIIIDLYNIDFWLKIELYSSRAAFISGIAASIIAALCFVLLYLHSGENQNNNVN